MGNCDSNEGDRSCKSGNTGGENTGKQDQKNPEQLDIYSHILSVSLSQLVCANGF